MELLPDDCVYYILKYINNIKGINSFSSVNRRLFDLYRKNKISLLNWYAKPNKH